MPAIRSVNMEIKVSILKCLEKQLTDIRCSLH